MFAYISDFFANNPRIANAVKWLAELQKFIVTGAVITYCGKPVYDKNGQLQTGFKAALKRGGKISLAVVTCGGTLVYDLIMDPPVTNDTVIRQVDVAVDMKHNEIRGELIKALGSANELAAKLEELLTVAIATKVNEAKEQLHAPEVKTPA
jgi:hypothetical protein